MAKSGDRFMRMLVFFDLPTLTKADRKNAQNFRQFLLKEGYIRLQWSVYSRICKGQFDVDVHSRRLKASLPEQGSIRLLTVTEKQYASMEILLGPVKKTEKIGATQLLLL